MRRPSGRRESPILGRPGSCAEWGKESSYAVVGTVVQSHAHEVGYDDGLLERVRAVRRGLLAVGPAALRSDGDFERVSLGRTDGDALRDILIAERPTTVIEVGLAYGSSALAIAEALVVAGSEHSRHIIIDAHQDEFHDTGWATLVEAGLDSICSLIRQRSQIALPRLLAEELVADAAFVDGSHLFHVVFVDLSYLQDLVRPGGLVIVDDYDWASVATAVRYFEVNLGWCTEPITAPSRLRAFRLRDPRLEPNFTTFKPFGIEP